MDAAVVAVALSANEIIERGRIDPALFAAAPVAWRCELDHRLHSVKEPSYVVVIDEAAGGYTHVGGIKRRARFARQMTVCGPCRRSVTDIEP